MKILITGTAGFIGFHLAKRLLESGCAVCGVDNLNPYYSINRFNQLLGVVAGREMIKNSDEGLLAGECTDLDQTDGAIAVYHDGGGVTGEIEC